MSVYIEQLITGGASRLGSSFIFPMAIWPMYSSGRAVVVQVAGVEGHGGHRRERKGDSAAFTGRSFPWSFR